MTEQGAPGAPRPGAWGWMLRWDEAVAGLALAVVFGAVVWGVFTRYIGPQPAVWASEVAAIGFAWVTFIGAAAAARRRLHIGVDLVTARLPARMSAGLAVLVSLTLAAGLAYAAWLAWTIGLEARARPTPVLRLPHTIVYLAPVIGLAAMSVGALSDAVRALLRIRTGHETPR